MKLSPIITTSFFRGKAPNESKVSIAKKAPRYFKGMRVLQLAPSDPWAKNWKESYLEDLKQRFPNGANLKELLKSIKTQVKNPVLCCYETKPAECHRHILAAYIKEHLNLDIPEWSPAQHG